MFDKALLINAFTPLAVVVAIMYIYVVIGFIVFVTMESKKSGESWIKTAKTSIAVMVRGYDKVFPEGGK